MDFRLPLKSRRFSFDDFLSAGLTEKHGFQVIASEGKFNLESEFTFILEVK